MNKAQALQESVSILDVLDALGISHHGVGTYQISCPNPAHEDINPSARLYGESNTVFCWACGKTWDVVELVRIVKEYSFGQACDFLETKFGEVAYKSNPRWMDKLRRATHHGFIRSKSVELSARELHNSFTAWFKGTIGFGDELVTDAYVYWMHLWDEIRLLEGISHGDRIWIYKQWFKSGKDTLTAFRASNFGSEDVYSTAYSGPTSSGRGVSDGGYGGRGQYKQCVRADGYHRFIAEELREHYSSHA